MHTKIKASKQNSIASVCTVTSLDNIPGINQLNQNQQPNKYNNSILNPHHLQQYNSEKNSKLLTNTGLNEEDISMLKNPSEYYTFVKVDLKECVNLNSNLNKLSPGSSCLSASSTNSGSIPTKNPDVQIVVTLFNSLLNKPIGRFATSKIVLNENNPKFNNEIYYFRVTVGASNNKELRSFITKYNAEIINSQLMDPSKQNSLPSMNSNSMSHKFLNLSKFIQNDFENQNIKNLAFSNILQQYTSNSNHLDFNNLSCLSDKNPTNSSDSHSVGDSSISSSSKGETNVEMLPTSHCYKLNFKIYDSSCLINKLNQIKNKDNNTNHNPHSYTKNEILKHQLISESQNDSKVQPKSSSFSNISEDASTLFRRQKAETYCQNLNNFQKYDNLYEKAKQQKPKLKSLSGNLFMGMDESSNANCCSAGSSQTASTTGTNPNKIYKIGQTPGPCL